MTDPSRLHQSPDRDGIRPSEQSQELKDRVPGVFGVEDEEREAKRRRVSEEERGSSEPNAEERGDEPFDPEAVDDEMLETESEVNESESGG